MLGLGEMGEVNRRSEEQQFVGLLVVMVARIGLVT